MLFGQRPTRGSQTRDGHSYGARVTATTSHVPSVTRIVLGSAAALLLASSIPAASATAGGGTVGPSVRGIRINFQLEGSERVCGYAPDYGDEYRERHGLRYGWNFDHTDVTRDRDRSNDQLLDTLSHFHRGGVWEIEVPNGVHDVKVVIGDAQHESRHTLNVEGVSYWDELYLDESEWRAEKRTVAVTDGRLTLDPGDAPDKATRIDYIEIDAQGAPPGCGDDEPTPVPSESPTPEPTPTVEPAPIPTQTPEIAPVRVNFQTERRSTSRGPGGIPAVACT